MWAEPWFGPLWLTVLFVFGAIWGSFANVVIYRFPRGESVVSPRSRCPNCTTPIAWYDNVPILSWIFLRARCRTCQTPISFRYPLVEFLTGVTFAALGYRFGLSFVLAEYLIFAWGLITCSFIDFDHMILPDVFTLSGVVLGLVGAALNPERSFWPALGGVLLGGGFLWAIAYIYLVVRKQEGMGGGDIKLLAWIGAVLGWPAVPFVVMASSLLGSVVGLTLAFRKPDGLKGVIPFGPYLALAALLYLFGADGVGRWYVSLFLPDWTSVN